MSDKYLMKRGIVVRRIERADAGAVQALAGQGSAMVHDAQGREGLLDAGLRPVHAGACIAGPAVTVLCPPNDNWMMHVAMECCQPGDVLVVAVTGDSTDAVCGGLLARAAVAQGVRGLVADAPVRDSAEFADLQFPAWSRGLCARGSVKAEIGSVNVPVICAGREVHPGDVIVADDDGVAVVPRDRAIQVVRACSERQQTEEEVSRRLAAGELGLDIYRMREKLQQAGLRYLDSADDLDSMDDLKD